MSQEIAKVNLSHNPVSRSKLMALFALAIGFVSTFAVAYITKVGNTVVPLVYVLSILCLLLGGYRFVNEGRFGCDKSVVVFVCWTGISCVMTLLYCVRGDFDSSALEVPLRGYLVLFCSVTMYVSASAVWVEKRWLFVGLVAGVLLNLIFSLLSLWAFEHGTYFNLYSVFPQDYYQIPLKYENWASSTSLQLITEYRPQGLFLECSHLMLFLMCILPLVFFEAKNALIKALIVFFGAFAIVTSKSPNAIFFIVEIIVLWKLLRKRNTESAVRGGVQLNGAVWILIFACVIGGLIFLVARPGAVDGIASQLGVAIADLDVTTSNDGGTTERWRNMQLAASLLEKYPFGIGWNLETYVMEHYFIGNVASSHTIILKYLVEIGPIGLALYIYLIYRHCWPLLGNAATSFQKILGLGVLFLFLGQATNGVSLAPWMWLLLGMANAEIRAAHLEPAAGNFAGKMAVIANAN